MTTLVAVRLPEQLDLKLNNLAKETGRSKSYYMKKALTQFIEDREDYLLAVAAMEENSPSIPYEKIRKELGLDD